MASNKAGYTVPAELRHDYKMLIQKANRHIAAMERQLQKDGISPDDYETRSAVLGVYADKSKWTSQKVALSRTVKFTNEKEFKQYVQHAQKMAERTYKDQKRAYENAVLKMLEGIALGENISMPGGKLPAEMVDKVRAMTLPQLKHWFNMGDPSDDITSQQYGSDDFSSVTDWESFVDSFETRMADLQRVY